MLREIRAPRPPRLRKGREEGERRLRREERDLRAHRPNELRPDNRVRPARQGRRFQDRRAPALQKEDGGHIVAILKLYSSGMTDEEMRVVIESLYDADVSKS